MVTLPQESQARQDRLTRRVLSVCDAAGAFIEYWGFKAIHGRAWALLALHKSPMAQNQIADMLGVSKALVSSAISELGDYGLVRPVSDKRNSPYVAVIDIWPVISEILREREWMLIETARLALEATLEEAEIQDATGGGIPSIRNESDCSYPSPRQRKASLSSSSRCDYRRRPIRLAGV